MYLYISFIYLSLFFSLYLFLLLTIPVSLFLSSLPCENMNVDVNLSFALSYFLAQHSFTHSHTRTRSLARSFALSLSLSFSHSLNSRTSRSPLFALSVRSFHFFASPSTTDRMIIWSFCTRSIPQGRSTVQSYLQRDSTIFILLYSKKPAL